MSEGVDKPERVTQDRVIKLFQEKLGYTYLGDWTDRSGTDGQGNSNVEVEYLRPWLLKRGYSETVVDQAIFKLKNEASKPDRDLYNNNKEVYKFLRYGVGVVAAVGQKEQTVWLIDWDNPENNDFAIAEEVTLKGNHDRRPDLVLYVNGVALGVIELKRSTVSIGEGVRQNISNQDPKYFHAWFFSTVQYVFAGNNSEGLRYGTIGTPEKLYLSWKEDVADASDPYKLDKYLKKMCEKSRFLEVIHDFVVFDAGAKKLPRPHQYFAIKAAQKKTGEGEGGIIWHTQGSGKSIVMVLLAQWLLEHDPQGRVLVVTDRDELDKQIERVFTDIGYKRDEDIIRTKSGDHLMQLLVATKPRLLCSLIHKFGPHGETEFDEYLKQLKDSGTETTGNFYVFVDEAHRSQGGKFHAALKGVLSKAIFIGFTGTPLLKSDADSRKVFGGYIHTYKVNEAVADGVILDLAYEYFNIEQRLGSEKAVDEYFEARTQALNAWQRNELKKKWATTQKVLSSRSRIEKIANHILLDFATRPRLKDRGNAILVASRRFDACRFYEYFQNTELKGKCAVVTSYKPNIADIKHEDTGEETETEKQQVYKTYEKLLADVPAQAGKDKAETYEDEAKAKFIRAELKLLIVVDKLLTGFDAPPCSVIYIDKQMQDHGLFQAICRTNRIDPEDDSKTVGTIVDYKNLFRKVQGAMEVYASELDEPTPDSKENEILIKTLVDLSKERLEEAEEALLFLEEPVPMPREDPQYQQYFCGNTEIEEEVSAKSPLREALYRGVVNFMRAIGDVSEDWVASGYTQERIDQILARRDHFLRIRNLVRLTAGEQLDLKPYEADMRRLIDMYVDASTASKIFTTHDIGLLDILDKLGAAETIKKIEESVETKKKDDIADHSVAAEIIENNIRAKIVKSKLSDPAYYETMSALLNQVIADRKADSIEYKEYLKRIEELAKKAKTERLDDTPEVLDTVGKRALWNNLGKDTDLAVKLYDAVQEQKPYKWRDNLLDQRKIKSIIHGVLQAAGVSQDSREQVELLFNIIREQAEFA